ncbi:MAG: anti-sigma factor, partial [Candidatus Limnocylindrales bacterium]
RPMTSPLPARLVALETPLGAPPDLSRLGRIAAIAAVVVIAALGAWNIGLSGQLSTAQQQQAAVDRVLAIAQEPGGKAAILVPGATGGPAGLAAVAPDGSFALAMHGLSATNGSQVYEAWVIAPSGSPLAIGSFVVGSDGNGTLTAAQVPSAAGLTVGLTREASPGATTPTLPMVVSGVTAQGS